MSWVPSVLPLARRLLIPGSVGLSLAVGLWYGTPQAWNWVRTHPYFSLEQVVFEGNRRLTNHELSVWAEIEVGASIWDIDGGRVARRLRSHPWVRHATVRAEFPQRLVVEISERKPFAMVRLDDLYYVDRHGHLLTKLTATDDHDFPIITGMEEQAKRFLTPVLLPRAAHLIRWCERTECFEKLAEVHVDSRHGVTVFPHDTPVALILGWGRWETSWIDGSGCNANGLDVRKGLAAVDVSAPDSVVVTLRESGKAVVFRHGQDGEGRSI